MTTLIEPEERTAPPVHSRTPVEWIKDNLFPNWWSGLVTIILAPTILYLAWRAFLFFFVNGQWEAVEVNLALFMQGTFPRDEQWRLIAQILIFALALGTGQRTRGCRTSARASAAWSSACGH